MIQAQFYKGFITPQTAKIHAERMDQNVHSADTKDHQALGAPSWYGLHWDLLEDCMETISAQTGIDVIPTYDYSRIYYKGHELVKHRDRPACEVSVTVNLCNKGGTWDFHWDGGSVAMNEGDGVVYPGMEVCHWRLPNPAEMTHQVFLHYVDANGPHAAFGNEYMRRKRKFVQA
jgi:hypothetical protein